MMIEFLDKEDDAVFLYLRKDPFPDPLLEI
jgi:hypothetical protein